MDEAIYYIAEIVSHFDIVAVQEVYKDLKALHRLIEVLGGYWKYVCTDATEWSHGNSERMVFLYDSRKVRFGDLSGELVLPPERIVMVILYNHPRYGVHLRYAVLNQVGTNLCCNCSYHMGRQYR